MIRGDWWSERSSSTPSIHVWVPQKQPFFYKVFWKDRKATQRGQYWNNFKTWSAFHRWLTSESLWAKTTFSSWLKDLRSLSPNRERALNSRSFASISFCNEMICRFAVLQCTKIETASYFFKKTNAYLKLRWKDILRWPSQQKKMEICRTSISIPGHLGWPSWKPGRLDWWV